MPITKLIKISEFTNDQIDKVIAQRKKSGLTRSWNNPAKDIASKNSDKNGKFLIRQIDEVLTASIMIDYDGHWGNVNYLVVDPDFLGAGYSKILIAEAKQLLLSVGLSKGKFVRQNL